MNVIGVVNSVTAVMPHMIERGQGQLVAISSLASYRGLPKSAAYCASKAAVSALFESLRLDLMGTGIDVSIIHPGFIKTPSDRRSQTHALPDGVGRRGIRWCARSKSEKRVMLFPGNWRTLCGPACFCRFHCMIGLRSEIPSANNRRCTLNLVLCILTYLGRSGFGERGPSTKHLALSSKDNLRFQNFKSEIPRSEKR